MLTHPYCHPCENSIRIVQTFLKFIYNNEASSIVSWFSFSSIPLPFLLHSMHKYSLLRFSISIHRKALTFIKVSRNTFRKSGSHHMLLPEIILGRSRTQCHFKKYYGCSHIQSSENSHLKGNAKNGSNCRLLAF